MKPRRVVAILVAILVAVALALAGLWVLLVSSPAAPLASGSDSDEAEEILSGRSAEPDGGSRTEATGAPLVEDRGSGADESLRVIVRCVSSASEILPGVRLGLGIPEIANGVSGRDGWAELLVDWDSLAGRDPLRRRIILKASIPGFADIQRATWAPGPGVVRLPDLVFRAGGSVAGVVRHADGRPAIGVEIRLRAVERAGPLRWRSDLQDGASRSIP